MQPVLIEPKKSGGQFRRRTGHSLKLGAIVAYELMGATPFSIIVHREGIEMSGTFPSAGPEGIEILRGLLSRAIRHHEHLKSFPIGTKQVILDESILYNEDMMQKIDNKIDG